MIYIRPVSDLRNRYPEIEEIVLKVAEEEANMPSDKYYSHEIRYLPTCITQFTNILSYIENDLKNMDKVSIIQ